MINIQDKHEAKFILFCVWCSAVKSFTVTSSLKIILVNSSFFNSIEFKEIITESADYILDYPEVPDTKKVLELLINYIASPSLESNQSIVSSMLKDKGLINE